jgi:hypothetical protein
VTKIGHLVVDLLRECEAIFKKTLTRVTGTYGELFDENNQKSKISCQGLFTPFNPFPGGIYFDRVGSVLGKLCPTGFAIRWPITCIDIPDAFTQKIKINQKVPETKKYMRHFVRHIHFLILHFA